MGSVGGVVRGYPSEPWRRRFRNPAGPLRDKKRHDVDSRVMLVGHFFTARFAQGAKSAKGLHVTVYTQTATGISPGGENVCDVGVRLPVNMGIHITFKSVCLLHNIVKMLYIFLIEHPLFFRPSIESGQAGRGRIDTTYIREETYDASNHRNGVFFRFIGSELRPCVG
jgi:hypothetical protein